MDGLAKNRIFLKEGKRDIGAEGLFVSLFGMYRKRLAHRICGRRRGEVALQALQIIYRAANWNKNPPVAFGFSKLTILSYVPTVSEKDRDKKILCQIFSSTSKPIVSCFQSFRGIRDDFRGVRKWLIFTLPRITKNIALCLWTTRFLFGSGNRTQNVNSKKD